MRTRLVTAILLAGLVHAAPARAQFPRVAAAPKDYTVEFSFNAWKPTPELTLSTGGGDADLVGAFGLETFNAKQYSLTIRPGRKHKFRLQYLPMTIDKSTTLSQSFTLDGIPYRAAVPATLSFDWALSRAGYQWDVLSGEGGYLGAIAEVKYNQIRAHVTADSIGSTRIRTNAPIPALGVAGSGYLVPKSLSMAFEITGFKLPKMDDQEARFVDWDIYIIGHLSRHLGFQGGFRSIDARYLLDGTSGTLRMRGPYAGVHLRF